MKTPKGKGIKSTFIGKSLEVKKVDHNFDGISYVDNNPIKIPFTKVGDIVSILDVNDTKRIPIASKINFVIQQKSRKEPICNVYGLCGGCKGQHLTNDEYIEIKFGNVVRLLSQFNLGSFNIENIKIFHHLDAPKHQRRRASFSVKDGRVGFKKYRSNEVIKVEGCPLLKQSINNILPSMQELVNNSNDILKITDIMVSNVGNLIDVLITSEVDLNLEILTILGKVLGNTEIARMHWKKQNEAILPVIIKNDIYLQFQNHKVKFSSGGFLQAEEFGENLIVARVKDYCTESVKVLDLFCGFGLYSFNLLDLPHIKEIKSIDITEDSISAINNVATARGIISAKKRDIMADPLEKSELDVFDTVILNPPRVGAKEQCVYLASTLNVDKIILIYCSVASLVRDLDIILQNDIFMIEYITLIDQFIFSEHIEIVVCIRRYKK